MINIVLFEPEIPFNTANIIRTCVGLNAKLHIIEPCGFDLNKEHKDLKRGSTNYMDDVELFTYENYEEFMTKNNIENNIYYLTRFGKEIYSKIEYKNIEENIFVMFGKESSGIPKEILQDHLEQTFRIPMDQKMRSLNLSNCVALVGFDLARQVNFEGLSFEEVQKKDFLN